MDLTDAYEDNVKEQKELIDAIGQLETEVKSKKLEAKELKEQLKINEQVCKNL